MVVTAIWCVPYAIGTLLHKVQEVDAGLRKPTEDTPYKAPDELAGNTNTDS